MNKNSGVTWLIGGAALLLAAAAACGGGAQSTVRPSPSPQPAGRLVLAVVGDIGCWTGSGCPEAAVAQPHEAAVARLVHSWNPDFVVSDGDNSYPDSGTVERVRTNLTPFASDLAAGRFYTALGDRDWVTGDDSAALNVYGRPAHYVSVVGRGLLAMFFADTHGADPDGTDARSIQAQEFQHELAATRAVWKITINHEPQFGSGPEGSYPQFRWLSRPGVDLSIAGGHYSEHLVEGGMNYVIEGSGGETLDGACQRGCQPGSVWHDGTHYGAMRLIVTPTSLRCDFFDVGGSLMHTFTITRSA